MQNRILTGVLQELLLKRVTVNYDHGGVTMTVSGLLCKSIVDGGYAISTADKAIKILGSRANATFNIGHVASVCIDPPVIELRGIQ